MARKLEPQPATTTAEDDPAVVSLAPNLPIAIAGREMVVREYGFFEGLEVAHRASRFIADMHATCHDGALRYDRIRRLFGVHKEVVVAIAAQAADVEPTWVEGLGRADADQFLSAWFSVNAGFFVHEVVAEMREERRLAAVAGIGTGTQSSPGSVPPASATSTASADTPSASSAASSTP